MSGERRLNIKQVGLEGGSEEGAHTVGAGRISGAPDQNCLFSGCLVAILSRKGRTTAQLDGDKYK